MAEAPLQAPLQNSTVQEPQKGSAPPKPASSRWKNLKEKWKSKLGNPKTLRNIAIWLVVLVFASFACGGVFIHEYVYGQDAADDTGLNFVLLIISGLLVVVTIAFLCFLIKKKDTILNSQFLRSRTKREKIGSVFLLGLLCVLLPFIFVIPGFYCALEYPNGDDWNRWLLAAGILFLVLGTVLLASFFFMLWKFDVSGFRTFVLKLLPRKNKNANGTSSVPMGIAVMSRASSSTSPPNQASATMGTSVTPPSQPEAKAEAEATATGTPGDKGDATTPGDKGDATQIASSEGGDTNTAAETDPRPPEQVNPVSADEDPANKGIGTQGDATPPVASSEGGNTNTTAAEAGTTGKATETDEKQQIDDLNPSEQVNPVSAGEVQIPGTEGDGKDGPNENKLEKAVEKAVDEVTSHIETLPEGSEEQAVVALRFGNLIDKLDEAKSKGAITQIEQSDEKDIFEPSENEETNQIRRGSVQKLIAAFKDLK